MNLKDYLAFKDAHQRGDKDRYVTLVVEHSSDVMDAIRDHIGAATSDDPPLVQYKDPVLIRSGSLSSSNGWAHRRGSALDATLPQADVFPLLEVGALLAERTDGDHTISVAIIRPKEGLKLIDDQLSTLRNSMERQRRESWRLQRIRANLDGLVK
jgi:hypothetical protein